MVRTNPDQVSSPSSQSSSPPGRRTLILALVGGAFALVVIAIPAIWKSLNGPPFQLVVEPTSILALCCEQLSQEQTISLWEPVRPLSRVHVENTARMNGVGLGK